MAGEDTGTFAHEVQALYLGMGRNPGKSKPFRPQKPCEYEGCKDWSRAQGYCFIHYQKMRKLGIIRAKRIKNDPIARFNASYKVNEVTGCWEWIAWRHPKGYGILCIGGKAKKIRAHRFSYQLHHGPIPKGMLVCHNCDNRRCVNPEHLFVGDDGVNVRDMVAKGRHGVRRGRKWKISPAMAMCIRIRFARGEHSMVTLAAIYRVDHRTISDIIRGRAHLVA